jgi:hypothetical protein
LLRGEGGDGILLNVRAPRHETFERLVRDVLRGRRYSRDAAHHFLPLHHRWSLNWQIVVFAQTLYFEFFGDFKKRIDGITFYVGLSKINEILK